MIVGPKKGKCDGTQQLIVNSLDKKYNLTGKGQNMREKDMIAVRTVQRLVAQNKVGVTPEKKGRKAVISRAFLKLVALHVNMEQVGVHGEMSVAQIRATLTAATLETVHENEGARKTV